MEQISIGSIFKVLWEKAWLIIIAAAICFTAGYGYCKLIAKPVYSSRALVCAVSGSFISENDNLANVTTYVTGTEISTSFALQSSFASILENATSLYEEIASSDAYSRKYTRTELKKATTIEYNTEQIILAVVVKVENPNDAVLIANDVAKLAEKYITGTFARTTVNVINRAEVSNKVSPNTAFTSIIAGVFGAAIVVLIILLVHFLDKSIKGEEDFKNHYNIPILGVVPDFVSVQTQKGGYYSE